MSEAGSTRRTSSRNARATAKATGKARGKPTGKAIGKPVPAREEQVVPAALPEVDDVRNDRSAKCRIGSAVLLEGFVDDVGARRVTGWVRNPDASSERCSVEIHLDDQVLTTVVADLERRDLKDAGVGDGRYAFEYKFDPPLDEVTRDRVFVRATSADGKIAAHQTRSFAQQADILETIGLELGEIGRRIDAPLRAGESPSDGGDLEQRLRALEGMHLRFDEALLRLMEERETLLEAESARTVRRMLVAIMLAVVSGLAVGMIVQWRFGLFVL
jgi:hypothetical protein